MSDKILLLGAGRRVSFAERLEDAGLQIFSYEKEKNAPIGEVAKIIEGYDWTASELYAHILHNCMLHEIKLILPLDDKSATLASSIASHDKNLVTPACRRSVATLCYDKQAFAGMIGGVFPGIYPFVKENQRVILKPRYGNGSKGISVVDYSDIPDEDNLREHNLIAQRYIENGTEYTVDSYFSKNGDLVDAVPRIRLRVADGEVVDSKTVKDKELINLVEELGQNIPFSGPVCFQFIRNPTGTYIMEINARFGGGCILSLQAGFDMIDCMIREYISGAPVCHTKGGWIDGIVMRRVHREFFYEDSSRP